MKGVILAGGSGTRIRPLTLVTSKQLLPIYDKPLIYFPLSTLMQLGVRDFLIITTPDHQLAFQRLLGNGSQFGVRLSYEIQRKPEGLAQGIAISRDFVNNEDFYFILGDNLFHGIESLDIEGRSGSATIFTKQVANPYDYGVVSYGESGQVVDLIEKPLTFVSSDAIVGLYRYDTSVFEKVKTLKPSLRGELEITDLNRLYLQEDKLSILKLNDGTVWFDTGSFEQMHDAASFVRGIQERMGEKIGDPFQLAKFKGYI